VIAATVSEGRAKPGQLVEVRKVLDAEAAER
jgi:hypothetical protein